jgi:16S rRNA processing protein RimM
MSEHRVVVGKITGVFGVRGWVKIYSYTEPATNILRYSPWQIQQNGQWHSVEVSEGQEHGKGLVAHLKNYDDRDQVARWIGSEIAVERAQLPHTQADEYYWTDLIGLTVITTHGNVLGVVDHLLETGANDVVVVRGEDKTEHLIPFVLDEFILNIDLTAKIMSVNWDAAF